MSLTKPRAYYQPFQYPWAYDAFKMQDQMHWNPDKIPMGDDAKDWANRLTPAEKNLLTQIFRFFTQADVEVQDNYMNRLVQVYKPPEVRMMLTAFGHMEGIHVDAYSKLIKTVGMPEDTYRQFMDYKAMKDKHDYFAGFEVGNLRQIARTTAAFGAFVEGVQLFASFVMLLNFTRFNKMKGMGTVVTWSIRDETLHCQSMIRLFREFVLEHPRIWDDELKRDIYTVAETVVAQEDAFIDLAFEMGPMEDLTADQVKRYIRYIADRRLLELGMKNIFKVKDNPLPWVDHIVSGLEHSNFFETTATEYTHAATQGSWEDAFAMHDSGQREVFN